MSDVVYLLPGLLCDRFIWSPQAEALAAAGFDVRVPDFRGCDSIHSMTHAVLADAPDAFSVAGFSMGVRVAIELVREAPNRILRLALLDGGTHPRRDGERAGRQTLVDLAYAKGMRAVAEAWLPPMVHPDRLQDQTLMAALTAMVERMSPEILQRQVEALLNRPDAEAVLKTITCPTLVAAGRADSWSRPDQQKAMANAIANARLVIFENCGHMAPVEVPEAVTAALKSWLQLPAVT